MKLRTYQDEALAWCLSTPRGYLAAKAGAGKTAVALALIDSLIFDSFDMQAALVVAPKRVVAQWAREAAKWAFGARLGFREYLGPPKARASALDAIRQAQGNVLVCSFEHFPELMKAIPLKDWPFGLVVFDEASRLRNGGRQGSVTWKAMNAVSRKTTSRILLMSGSPRPGTAHELWGPVALLDRGLRLGQTLAEFRARFLQPDKWDHRSGQVYSWKVRLGQEPALYAAIQDLFFAVSPDLGLRFVEIDRWVQLPVAIADACEELQREQVVDLDALEVTAGSQGVVAGKLHQLCQGAVFDASGAWHEVHDEKLLELDSVIEEIDAPTIVCVWYDHDRERVLARYPNAVDITTEAGLAAAQAGRVRLAVLHPASAAHGIDGLQAHFSDLVWFALPASFELYSQTIARICRSGQATTVRAWRILAAGGIVDQRIAARLVEKEAGQETFFSYLETAA